jgi:hypothetical protein
MLYLALVLVTFGGFVLTLAAEVLAYDRSRKRHD